MQNYNITALGDRPGTSCEASGTNSLDTIELVGSKINTQYPSLAFVRMENRGGLWRRRCYIGPGQTRAGGLLPRPTTRI